MRQHDDVAGTVPGPDYETVVAVHVPEASNGVFVEGLTVVAIAAGTAYHYRLKPGEALTLAAALTANVAAIARVAEDRRAELAKADPAGTA